MPDKDKKPSDRGVADSIAALRLKRWMDKGPGAKPAREPAKPSVDGLRDKVASVGKKAKAKRGKRR
jgi:hypothetical protein